MNGMLFELKDFRGWTEDKAWLVGDNTYGVIEFDDGSQMQFGSYYEAEDWLYDRGYKI